MATTVRHEDFGKDLGLIHEVVVAGRKVGATREFWSALAHNQWLIKDVVGYVFGKVPRTQYPVVVNYDLSLDEVIGRGGYRWVEPNIKSENFPAQGEGQVELMVELFHQGRTTPYGELMAEVECQGYRHLDLRGLVALGTLYRNIQYQFDVVALGEIWTTPTGAKFAPVLYGSGRPCLDLIEVGEGRLTSIFARYAVSRH